MSETKLEEIASLLRELVRWSKFGSKQQLKSILADNLRRDPEKLIFEYSDGERSVRDIEKLTGIGKTSVFNYWQKWFKLGIVKSTKFEGRMQHICSLEEVGLEVPSNPVSQHTTETSGSKDEGDKAE